MSVHPWLMYSNASKIHSLACHTLQFVISYRKRMGYRYSHPMTILQEIFYPLTCLVGHLRLKSSHSLVKHSEGGDQLYLPFFYEYRTTVLGQLSLALLAPKSI